MKKFLLTILLIFCFFIVGCTDKIEKFNVQFVNYDGSELKKETVEKGKGATPPTDPIRTGYTFTGWDKDFSNITSDLIVTAEYVINTYTVLFLNHDGVELKKETVEYGKDATAPVNPTRSDYTFIGWDKEFKSVDKDLIVTASFVLNNCLVQFLDYNGTELKKETVKYGKDATAPANPSRTGYTFIGWDKATTNITNNTTFTAQYEIINYTLTYNDNLTKTIAVQWENKEIFLNEFYSDFYNWIDNNASKISGLTKVGTKFTMTKSTKTATWSSVSELRALDIYDVERTIGTLIYKPFNRVGNEPNTPSIDNNYFLNTEPYRTKYLDLDRYFLNAIIERYTTYNKGYNANSSGAVQIFFRFHQWNKDTIISSFEILPFKNIIDTHTGDITVPNPKTFNMNDSFGVVLPTYTGVVFLGWYDNKIGSGNPITKIDKGNTDNITLYAKWDFDTSNHEVIFVDNDGIILLYKTIKNGESITDPLPSMKFGYIFKGWDKNIMNINSDITFTAQYVKVIYKITYNQNTSVSGVILPTEPLSYSIEDNITLPQPTLEGYIFVGWYTNPECTGDEVTTTLAGDLDLYARWVKIPGAGESSGDGSVNLVADETNIEINRSTTIYAMFGKTYLAPSDVKFSSLNTDIAVIDEDGFVITKGIGKVTILAITPTSSASIELTVQNGPTDIRWVGHRGSGGPVVQNTTSAFEEGGKRGYYAMECDVRVSSDDVYYICHDDIFLPYLFVDTSLHDKLMGGYSWAQLKTYQVKDSYNDVTYFGNLATVEEYLNICKKYGVKAVLELKWTNGINSNDQSKLDGLVRLVKNCGMYEDAIFMTSMKNCLTYLRNNYADCNLQFLSGSTTTNMENVNWCIQNRISLDATNDKLTKGIVDAMHNAGLYVNAYTVNSSSVADNLIAMGVDMITTDNLGIKK